MESGKSKKVDEKKKPQKPQLNRQSMSWRGSPAASKDCWLPNVGQSFCWQAVSAVLWQMSLSQRSHSDFQTSGDSRLSWFGYRGSPWRLAQVQAAGAHLREARWPCRQVLLVSHLTPAFPAQTSSCACSPECVPFLSSFWWPPEASRAGGVESSSGVALCWVGRWPLCRCCS